MTYLLSLLLQLVGEAISFILNMLIELFSTGIGLDGEMTLASFYTLFTFCRAAYQVFMAAAYFILFTICVFQLFKSFFGPLAEAESPLALIAKTIFFTILVTFSERICQFVINIGTIPYKILDSSELYNEAVTLKWDGLTSSVTLDASELATAVGGAGLFAGGAVAAGSIMGGAQLLLLFIVIFLLLILKEFFKLFLEIIERYVILGLLTTVAPLCIATGASKATSQVFRSFIKMYISQIIVMCFSIFFLKAFALAFGTWLGNIASAEYTFRGQTFSGANFFVQGLMVLAWLKLGQKIDAHMGQLGLSVAQAGGMADAFMSGINSGLNPGSGASMISNKLSNKLAGTNFSRATKGSENAWAAALSGRLNRQSARLDALGPNRAGITTTNKQRTKAADQLKQMGASGKSLSAADFNKALMANNKSGGSAETGGVAVGNSIKEALGIGDRSDIIATEGSYIGNGKGHLEYKTADGKTGYVDFDTSANSDKDRIGSSALQGQGALEGMAVNITGGNGALKNELTGTDLPIGPNTNVNSPDIEPIDKQGQIIEEDNSKANNAETLADAQHWGEEPKREDFPEGEEGDKAYEEAMQQYKDSAENMIAPDGKIYENGATIDEEGNIVGKELQLEDSAGNEVSATELARFDKDGNEITKDSDQFKNEDGSFNEEKYNEAYANGKLTDKDGNMMTADGHNPVGIVDANGKGELYANNISDGSNFSIDSNGNIAKAASESGEVMQHTVSGDKARLDNNGQNGFVADENGNMAYDQENGKFVDAKNAIDENGKIADGIAGKYLDANKNEVSAKEALDENGKLKEGFSSEVAKFSQIDANSEFAKDMAKQDAAGGVQLAYNDSVQKYQKYDANGNESKDGTFVKVGDQLVSESAFKTGDNKQLDTYKSVNTDMSGGYQALATKDGKVQTFNEKGEADSNGQFVRSATQNDHGRYSYYDKSSFNANDNGKIDTFKNTGETVSKNILQATSSGMAMTFNSDGNASANGNYYKKLSDDGSWQLVSKADYQTNDSGNLKTFNDNGNGFGRYVKSVDESGRDQGYAKLANYSPNEAPKRYAEVNGKFQESAHGEYVATVGKNGQTEYTRVMQAGAGAQWSGDSAVPTYDAKPMTMEIANLDGSAASIKTLGYQSAGSSGGGSYCKDAQGNYREIAPGSGYTTDGKSIQRYAQTDSGDYVPSSEGNYAMVVDSSNPSASAEYVPITSTDTYNPNLVTSNGMPIADTYTKDGKTYAELKPRSFDAEYRGEGMYAAEIGGQSYTLYDASVWDADSKMNEENTQVISMGGRSFYAVSSVNGFDVKENQRPNRTYFGKSSADYAKQYDLAGMNEKANDKNRIPVDFNNRDLAMCETNQGKAFFNSTAERKYVPGKDGQPGHYEAEAFFVTNTKPDGERGSYQTMVDKNTGNVVYGMKTKLRYDSKIGGTATLTFGRAIRDGNNSKRGSVVAKAKRGVDPIIRRAKMKNPARSMRGR